MSAASGMSSNQVTSPPRHNQVQHTVFLCSSLRQLAYAPTPACLCVCMQTPLPAYAMPSRYSHGLRTTRELSRVQRIGDQSTRMRRSEIAYGASRVWY
eukprot:508909-Rhodomonas_salina.2